MPVEGHTHAGGGLADGGEEEQGNHGNGDGAIASHGPVRTLRT